MKGEKYIGHKALPSILPFALSVENHNAFVCKIAAGNSCDVYYNPNCPEDATLTKQYSIADLVVASVVLIVIGIYLFVTSPFMQINEKNQ